MGEKWKKGEDLHCVCKQMFGSVLFGTPHEEYWFLIQACSCQDIVASNCLWFNAQCPQPTLSNMPAIHTHPAQLGLRGWRRLHTCGALRNQCSTSSASLHHSQRVSGELRHDLKEPLLCA